MGRYRDTIKSVLEELEKLMTPDLWQFESRAKWAVEQRINQLRQITEQEDK
jgi:hypothetical protein